MDYFNCISTCNSKIYTRTYLCFYILAKCKACTQKVFQTLLLHPSMYSIAKNSLRIFYLIYTKILSNYTENKMIVISLKKMKKIFFCYFLAVQYLFTKDSCALICCNFAFARVKLVKIKKCYYCIHQ